MTQDTATPPPRYVLEGMNYYAFLDQLMQVLAPRSYFEIGVHHGKSFLRSQCASVGVDPQFDLRGDIVGQKPQMHLFQMPSDEFFARFDLKQFFEHGVDLAFLDGMHLFEFLLRDFIATEKAAAPGATFLLHDCLPINAEMAERERMPGARKDREYKSYWTGDVWKMVSILREYRPDLDLQFLDCAPTGLVVVKRLDPASTVLTEAYDAIVAKYLDIMLTDDSLATYRAALNITSGQAYLDSMAS